MSYGPQIDQKWQKRWEAENLAAFDENRITNKLYVLEMFSYPSGANLHIGHWYNYALADTWARLKKLQGYEIFQPMGFDAFGLPAENYAIKTGIHPKDSTLKNIATMEKQLQEMGALFNWEHELATCDPEYYRWNQWLFLQLYKHDLAYRKKAPVNWCPTCNTVLANEQVLADGTCERCDSVVDKKNLTQWFFRITAYAQELLDDLSKLNWPEKTKKIQQNWIGRSAGAEVTFRTWRAGAELLREDGTPLELKVFTTRADTLLGVTYLVVAPESELCDQVTSKSSKIEVRQYQEQSRKASEIERLATNREKTGAFTGSYALHPITGAKLPIWTSDYVIASYGTGVVMAVPAHDERDFEFAQKFNLPCKSVIASPEGEEIPLPYCEYGTLYNSGCFDGLSSQAAQVEIVAALHREGKAEERINYRLRDWLVSRQRYWGTPIPMIHCPQCGVVPVPEEALPIELPYEVEFTPDGESPLQKCESFMACTCPQCGAAAQRDPDTLDTFVDSSWYQLRYVDNKNSQEAFSKTKVNKLCPVDMYVGGAEHAAMHLLYARFICKALRDLGYLDFDEPFLALIHQGTLLGPDGLRMSKSKGNTISPDDYVSKYGSDAFRLYLAFGFAYIEGGPWSDDGLKAIVKFIGRIEKQVEDILAHKAEPIAQLKAHFTAADKDLFYALNYCIQQVSLDAVRFQFNTSVARLMELLNALQKYQSSPGAKPGLRRYVIEQFVILLAPFAPHLAEELWEQLAYTSSIFRQSWPSYEAAALQKEEVEIAIQVNGKIVERVMVPSNLQLAELDALLQQHPSYALWLGERQLVKTIAVVNRLYNIVVK